MVLLCQFGLDMVSFYEDKRFSPIMNFCFAYTVNISRMKNAIISLVIMSHVILANYDI